MSEALETQEVEETPVEAVEESAVEEAELEEGIEASGEVEAETTEELQDEIADAIEEGATEEEVTSMIRKYQLKVNGKTVEREIDLSDEDAVRRELQKAAAFQQTSQESAELKKMYENEIRSLQANPWEKLKELGLDPEELNERYLEERIQELKKSPDQIERENMEKELSKARERLKDIENKEAEAKEAQILAQAEAELESEIIEALDAHKTLPPTQKTMSRIADALMFAMDYAEENGFDSSSVSVADVIPYVEDEYRQEMRALLDNAPEQMLEEYVGKQNLERLRKNRVLAVKNNPKQIVKQTSKSIKTQEKPKEKIKASDYFRNLSKEFNN
jgi:hypothetical protein